MSPGSGVHSAIGPDHEHVQLVRTPRDCCNPRPYSSDRVLDPPPPAPLALDDAMAAGSGVHTAIRPDHEHVHRARTTRDGSNRCAGLGRRGLDPPPSLPLAVGGVPVPSGGVDPAIGPDYEHVQLVRTTR